MKLELTPELWRAAKRCIWCETPEEAVVIPARMAAYILTYGLPEDVQALRDQLANHDFAALLDAAPPGIFDARSWAYWNLVAGRPKAPPMPERRLPTDA